MYTCIYVHIYIYICIYISIYLSIYLYGCSRGPPSTRLRAELSSSRGETP